MEAGGTTGRVVSKAPHLRDLFCAVPGLIPNLVDLPYVLPKWVSRLLVVALGSASCRSSLLPGSTGAQVLDFTQGSGGRVEEAPGARR